MKNNDTNLQDNIYSASDIAKYFIWKANKEKKPLTNKKLQKLLYYSQAWNLVLNKKPLFKEEIEAWVHGPVIRSVYNKYKTFGYQPISDSLAESDSKKITEKMKILLDEVWQVYGKYDAEYLEVLTHNEKPWQESRGNLDAGEVSSAIISRDTMKAYYAEKLKE